MAMAAIMQQRVPLSVPPDMAAAYYGNSNQNNSDAESADMLALAAAKVGGCACCVEMYMGSWVGSGVCMHACGQVFACMRAGRQAGGCVGAVSGTCTPLPSNIIHNDPYPPYLITPSFDQRRLPQYATAAGLTFFFLGAHGYRIW